METGLFGGKAMEDSWLKGDAEAGILPAGQISGLIDGVLSVREIIEEMVGEKNRSKRRLWTNCHRMYA